MKNWRDYTEQAKSQKPSTEQPSNQRSEMEIEEAIGRQFAENIKAAAGKAIN
ncbi:MAG TPA: hypothetical protein VF214_09105 [Edaphobacter sp.]